MGPAYAFAVRQLHDRALAEDVTQEALVSAYIAIASFRGDAKLATWLLRIVHNACRDAERRMARRPRIQQPAAGEAGWHDGLAGAVDPAPGPAEAAEASHGHRRILEALHALSPEHRAVVVLRDIHDLSYAEVAAVTAQSIGTVKSRLHRAHRALRFALGTLPDRDSSRPASVAEPAAPAAVQRDEGGRAARAAGGMG